MIQYIYFVKCPNCEDEHFDFFEDAKSFALGCLSSRPIITQVEVDRDDFGICVDSNDLGTVWSWEDMVQDIPSEPEGTHFFKKNTLCHVGSDSAYDADNDPEFINLDNTLDTDTKLLEDNIMTQAQQQMKGLAADPIERPTGAKDRKAMYRPAGKLTQRNFVDTWKVVQTRVPSKVVADGFASEEEAVNYIRDNGGDDKLKLVKNEAFERKPIPDGMTIDDLVEELEANEDTVECAWCEDLYEKTSCRHDRTLGWLCTECVDFLKSTGNTLAFESDNNITEYFTHYNERTWAQIIDLTDIISNICVGFRNYLSNINIPEFGIKTLDISYFEHTAFPTNDCTFDFLLAKNLPSNFDVSKVRQVKQLQKGIQKLSKEFGSNSEMLVTHSFSVKQNCLYYNINFKARGDKKFDMANAKHIDAGGRKTLNLGKVKVPLGKYKRSRPDVARKDGKQPALEAVNLAEAITSQDTVELDYDNITVTVYGRKLPGGYWDPPEYEEAEVDIRYTYEADATSVIEFLQDEISDEEICELAGLRSPSEIPLWRPNMDDATKAAFDNFWDTFWENHLDTLVEKYKDQLLANFEDDASEAAQEWADENYTDYFDDYDD